MNQIFGSLEKEVRTDGPLDARSPLRSFPFGQGAFVKAFVLLCRFLTLLVLLGGSFAARSEADSIGDPGASEEAVPPETLKRIRDPAASERDFFQILSVLPYIADEPPSVWADIVTDNRYDDRRRKLAMAVLLRRHVKFRMTLSELARLIPKNKLFTTKRLKTVEDFGERSCPEFWLKGNVFFLQMVPEPGKPASAAFYFVLDRKGEMAKAMLASALQGQDSAGLNGIQLLDLVSVFRSIYFSGFP